jgi:hypothetical protein
VRRDRFRKGADQAGPVVGEDGHHEGRVHGVSQAFPGLPRQVFFGKVLNYLRKIDH